MSSAKTLSPGQQNFFYKNEGLFQDTPSTIKEFSMTQPLLPAQPDLRYFQFNNEEKTVIDLSKFTFIRADKIGITSNCCLAIFCSTCVRAGRIQLTLQDIATNQNLVTTIAYDHERDLMADLEKVTTAFRNAVTEGAPR